MNDSNRLYMTVAVLTGFIIFVSSAIALSKSSHFHSLRSQEVDRDIAKHSFYVEITIKPK